MKKIVFLLAGVALLTACKKDDATSKIKKENLEQAQKRDSQIKGAPVISFDKEVFEFGTVNEGVVVETTFTITNTGESDLIISDAKATCGCTVPTWPKDPIAPGKSGEIQVKFNTLGKPNKQSKTVTLYTNTEKGNEAVRITGIVTPKNK